MRQDLDNVKLKRSWAVWLLLPIPFIVGDLLLWRDQRSGALAHFLVEQALVPVAMVGSIATALFLLSDLFQRVRGDHLEINAEGVVDRMSKWRLETVRWDEIAYLRVLRRSAARIEIKIETHSPLRRRLDNSDGTVLFNSLAMTDQQERTIRRLMNQAKQPGN